MASCSQIQEVSTISALEQELINGLLKLQIQDVDILPEKIQETEERIKDHPEHEQLLKQLKDLTLLNEEITELKYTRPVEGNIEWDERESLYVRTILEDLVPSSLCAEKFILSLFLYFAES
jgi:hypothetical protein